MAPHIVSSTKASGKCSKNIVRLWAKGAGPVYVMTESIFDRDRDGKRDADSDAKRMKSNNGKERVGNPNSFFQDDRPPEGEQRY